MTKEQLYRLTGGPSAAARIFGITPSAVSQWPDPIPEARVYELRGRRPELFELKPPAASGDTPPVEVAA
jgi:hypothetical protein